ncbi:MAG TPA: hypothetical protein VHZ53_05995 [Steroidobacteraceae bacterium]|jgi:hypothetical protein|nr:hypothetical protein [Steroidobacteraceae bacterium]
MSWLRRILKSAREQPDVESIESEKAVAVIESIATELRAERDRRERTEKSSARRELWVLVALVATAAAGTVQAILTQHSINDARESYLRDRRAWLEIRVTGALTIQIDSPVKATFEIDNSGKTPARDVAIKMLVESVKVGSYPTLRPGDDGGIAISTSGIIFPGPGPNPLNAVWLAADGKEAPKLTSAEMRDVIAGKTYFVLYGRVTYKDIFHVEHWTEICRFYTPIPLDLPPTDCLNNHNGADDN